MLEATRIGGGTSGISFAWTNAHQKPPKPYHDLNVAGMKAHAALADEFGATPWWHGGGSLEWEAEPGRAAQRENFEQLRSWGYAAEWKRAVRRSAPGGTSPRHRTLIRWRRVTFKSISFRHCEKAPGIKRSDYRMSVAAPPNECAEKLFGANPSRASWYLLQSGGRAPPRSITGTELAIDGHFLAH